MSDENPNREIRSFFVGRDPSIDPRQRIRLRPENLRRLEFDNLNEFTINQSEEESSSDIESGVSNVDDDGAQIYLRLRPIDISSGCYNVGDCNKVLYVRGINDSTSSNKNLMEHVFQFSEIFEKDASQMELYSKCVQSKIEMEENFSLLTYGTSGSGKTFTLLGTTDSPGIVPRALEHIFCKYRGNLFPQPNFKLVKGQTIIINDEGQEHEENLRRTILKKSDMNCKEFDVLVKNIEKEHDFAKDPESEVSVWVWISFLEIYNENVYDLIECILANAEFSQSGNSMCPPSKSNLKIICNDGKVIVKGLKSIFVNNSLEAITLMRNALKHANYATTNINNNSSRSHCVFIVDIIKFYRSSESEVITYKFCDLAGSERLHKTGNVGSRLKEAQQINKSLLVLGRCLDAATRKKSNDIIPFRESKLTMLLQTALTGREKLSMIVNLMPSDEFFEENMNVLNFSSIAKEIIFSKPIVKTKCTARFSFVADFQTSTEKLLKEVNHVQNENRRLMDLLATAKREKEEALLLQEQRLRSEMAASFSRKLSQSKASHEERLNLELASQKRLYESKIETYQRKLKEAKQDLEDLSEEFEDFKRRHEKPENVINLDESSEANESSESSNECQENKENLTVNLNDSYTNGTTLGVEKVQQSCDLVNHTKRRTAGSDSGECQMSNEEAKKPRVGSL